VAIPTLTGASCKISESNQAAGIHCAPFTEADHQTIPYKFSSINITSKEKFYSVIFTDGGIMCRRYCRPSYLAIANLCCTPARSCFFHIVHCSTSPSPHYSNQASFHA